MEEKPNISFNIIKHRLTISFVLLAVAGIFLFNHLLSWQGSIMYKYFIEKPAKYNIERAERMASSIYRSFKEEVKPVTNENIEKFLSKYNEIPFLSVNFIITDKQGVKRAIVGNIADIDILGAEFIYTIKDELGKTAGDLLVYDINKEYKEGLNEYRIATNFTRASFILLLALLLAIIVIHEYTYKIKQEKKIAEYDAMHDGLTGLCTHKHFMLILPREMERARRYNRPLSLIIIDVDHFKKFNDEYGHLVGDMILKKISKVVASNVRQSDIVARYGGDEFAIILPETGLKGAEAMAKKLLKLTSETIIVADRIRKGIREAKVKYKDKQLGATISMGISSYDASEDFKPEYLISQADQALYESKRKGRDQITLFEYKKDRFKESS